MTRWTDLLSPEDQQALTEEMRPLEEEQQRLFDVQAGTRDPSVWAKIYDVNVRMHSVLEAWRVSTLLGADEEWVASVRRENAAWKGVEIGEAASVDEIRADLIG